MLTKRRVDSLSKCHKDAMGMEKKRQGGVRKQGIDRWQQGQTRRKFTRVIKGCVATK